MNGYTIMCGPFDTRKALLEGCIACSNSTYSVNSQLAYAEPVVLHVEKSLDLTNWTEISASEVDPNNFEFNFINPMSESVCYYRAWF